MKPKFFSLVWLVFIFIAGSLISCLQQPQQQSPQQAVKIMKSTLSPPDSMLVYRGNFYETWWDIRRKYPEIKDSAEGSYQNYLDRMMMNWGYRLFPDGDCQRAAEALSDYTYRYLKNATSGDSLPFDPRWTNIGPIGMPEPKNPTDNQHGVGQMHRITFHPAYNGTTNQTIFACSFYGGLWKSTDDGLNWFNLNTDFLPFCSVADVCINKSNPQQLFICTGYADDGFFARYDPNWCHANPIFTSGIFRSLDAGQTWKPINDGFQADFTNGGTCRRMIINPGNPDQIFVATTRGIYRTNNATSTTTIPVWQNVLPSAQFNDVEFRGLEFRPGSATTLYASGTDIYQSTDGGTTWQSITGTVFGIDLKNYPGYHVNRINITVTPADPDRLYAYVEGYKLNGTTVVDGCLILMRKGQQWKILDERYTTDAKDLFSSCYIGIAVSPVNPNKIYYGNTIVYGNNNWTQGSAFSQQVGYFDPGFHADVHDLKFQPLNDGDPKLFCAHHGGISVLDFGSGWSYRSEGLSVATIWAFDDGGREYKKAMTAHQDCGTNVYAASAFPKSWKHVWGGDGYSARISDQNPDIGFLSTGDASFRRYSFVTSGSVDEMAKIPKDQVTSNPQYCIVVKTFPMVNHPVSGLMLFGFTELYERQMDIPYTYTPRDQLWHRLSDIYTIEPGEWRRQIIEMAISPTNADTIYLVTAGQQNEPWAWQLNSGLYRGIGSATNYTWTRITHPGENVNNDTLAIITGIAVDPNDDKKIWISYTGYWPEFKVWYSTDAGANWSTSDPYHELFNLPVNAIVYHQGRLYIGTDAGVYYSDDNTHWKKYGRFPNVRVTEMKVNESNNKLRVATYGRGLWEGDLMAP